MSTIGAQCDELRSRARALRQGRWSDGAEDAGLMERAADTIWELRCKLGDLVDVELVRCMDCRHATITVNGKCKYCEMFWLPDEDGYGAISQVYLPGDFYCGFGERRGEDA